LLDKDLIKAELILNNWQPDDLRELAFKEESKSQYFVAGYIVFYLKKKISCTSFQETMVVRDNPPQSITFDVPTNHDADLTEYNEQGGLVDSIRSFLPLLCIYSLHVLLHYS
ncbi:Uncharacterized protein FKW44_007130, partial [Caligus rogercresseyi]